MWLERPIWMLRYHLSSWLMSAAMAIIPSPRYRAELRRRVYAYRDEVIAEVSAQRIVGAKQNQQ